MPLRKKTIDNSVRFIKKSEQTKESKPNELKKQSISGSGKSNSRNQNKNISQNNKKFVKDFTARGFGILK